MVYIITFDLDWFFENTSEPRFICMKFLETKYGVSRIYLMLSAKYKHDPKDIVIYLEDFGLYIEPNITKLKQRAEELKKKYNLVEGFVTEKFEDIFK